jgi:hypothetical protein
MQHHAHPRPWLLTRCTQKQYTTIYIDHQPARCTIEVSAVWADRMLPESLLKLCFPLYKISHGKSIEFWQRIGANSDGIISRRF